MGNWRRDEIDLPLKHAPKLRAPVNLTPEITVVLGERQKVAHLPGCHFPAKRGHGKPQASHDPDALNQRKPICLKPGLDRSYKPLIPYRLPRVTSPLTVH